MNFKPLLLLLGALPLGAASLQDGFSYYNQGQCAEALNNFEAHFLEAKDPQRLHRAWADCAMKTGDGQAALSAYERVLMFDPSDVDARLALVSLYRDAGMPKEADEMLRSVEGYSLSAAQRERYETLSGTISKLPLDGYVSFIGGYDSNVNGSASSELLSDYFDGLGAATSPTSGPRDDSYATLNARINYRQDIKQLQGLYFGAMLDALSKRYLDEDYYDINMVTARLSAGYANRFFSINLPVEYRRVHHLDRDLFEQAGFRPSVTLAVLPSTLLSAGMEIAERDYIQDADMVKNDRFAGANAGIYYIADKELIYLSGAARRYFATHAEALPFTTKTAASLSAGMKYTFDDGASAHALMRVGLTQYTDPSNLTSGEVRYDGTVLARLEGEYPLNESFDAVAELQFLNSMSNYRPAVYTRYNAGLGVKYNF